MSSATFVETHNAREGGARAPHKNFKALQSRERIRREFPFEELEKEIGSARSAISCKNSKRSNLLLRTDRRE